MKQKSMRNKIIEGRCLGRDENYVGMILAREAHSSGQAAQLCDPISGRAVNVLSVGEQMVFWMLRFNPEVVEIREQMIMLPNIVKRIRSEMNLKDNGRITEKVSYTIDFLAMYSDGRKVGISVKDSRDDLNPDTAQTKTERRKRIQAITSQVILI